MTLSFDSILRYFIHQPSVCRFVSLLLITQKCESSSCSLCGKTYTASVGRFFQKCHGNRLNNGTSSKLILSQVFSSLDQPLTSQLLLKDSSLLVQAPALPPSNIQQTCSCNLPVHSCCLTHSTHSQQILIYSSNA